MLNTFNNTFLLAKKSFIIQWWNNSTFGDKLYLIFAAFMILVLAVFVFRRIQSSPKKKLDFVVNAQKNGCMEVGRLTCLIVRGAGKAEYYEAEYMYVVDNVRYFVTYSMIATLPIDEHKDNLNADMLLLRFKPFMLMYYDKNNPKKALSKIEIFTSKYAINKIKTPKSNVYRDVYKDWVEPIDLIQY